MIFDTSTMGPFTPSPNRKYNRSSVFPKIKRIFARILRRCHFQSNSEINAFIRPLEGEAREYGDYVCFNVLEICDELRKKNPDLFDEIKPKDIALVKHEISRELKLENTNKISRDSIQLHDIGVISFMLHDVTPRKFLIMAASAIIISSDSSDESVGSPPSRVILFGDIPTVIPSTSVVAPETSTIAPVISSAAPMVETTLVASPTGLCGLDPYVATVARWRSRVTARPSSSHEFPIAPVTAPPGIRRRSATLIRPGEAIPFGRPYRTHLNGPHHHSSSSSSSSDSSPVHSLGLDAPDQAHSGSSTRDVSPRLSYPPRRAPRCSEAFRRWCAAPLSTWYPPTTSESSSGGSPERPMHLSSHSAGPSRKRCRSPVDSVPLSMPVTGSLAPTRADLSPPRKRFRDSYSSEASLEEDAEVGLTGTGVDMELGIGDGDEVGDHVEIDHRDARDDTEEYEADASAGDTAEVGEHHDVVEAFVVGVMLILLLEHTDYIQSHIISERPMHLSSHSAGPSRKRCRSPVDSAPLSIPVTGSLAPTHANLSPPRKRFRDSYSSKANIEEDAEVGLTGTEVDMELGIGDGDEVGDHVGIDHSDARDDTKEYEADASAGDTTEVGIDPMTAPLVEEEIVDPAGEDSPDSSGTRDGIVRLVEDTPVDLGNAVRDFYHHMSEVRVDRIVGIETAQRRLEADQLIASGDRARMAEMIYSLRLENLKVRAMLDIERDRVSSLRLHMSLSQEEFRQIRRDRDDAQGRLRRLESYLGRCFGFRT
ncbi:hypothetical protein Tco_0250791 [Tanacetum coccineum]